jgi:hypothetical protein
VNINAREIKTDQRVTVTGKLGSYTDKGEDGFMLTITTNDVVIPGDNWHGVVPAALSVKHAAIYLSEDDPRFKELKREASEGKTVTLQSSFRIWERQHKAWPS